ncbi:MAG: hypothetical protein JO053_14375 [Acidobacteria bacterium]|nr:hypothetical protein [Acidobacteriota bacterium]
MAQHALKLEEPKGELLSKSAIARHLKIDKATLTSRLDDLGYEPHESSTPKNQLYWFDDEMEFAIKAAKDTVSAMKIREMRARAEKLEMANAVTRGELVPQHEVTDIIQRIVSTLYQEYTVRQPKRIGGQLVKAKTIAAVRKALKTDGDRIQKMLRTNFERFISE